MRQDIFSRIRGTNLGYNRVEMDAAKTKIVYGTEKVGSPPQNIPGTNNAEMAWKGLWFLSKPIFVYVNHDGLK